MKGIIMMKRQTSTLLAGLIVASLGCSSAKVRADNDGLVAGLCVGAAALLGVAGAVAWCCSETDEQLIARVETQYHEVWGRYREDMTYFGRPLSYTSPAFINSNLVAEVVLHDFATHVWHTNVTLHDYCSGLCVAKNNLQSCVQALRKRIAKLEKKSLGYEEQQQLRKMRQLIKDAEIFLKKITWFADILEAHKDYFNLYDTIDIIRAKYFHEIMLFESERYATETEIKRSILNRDNSQYAFRTFVINIKSDISTLESKIHALKHQYNAKREYAYQLVDYLVAIKNMVVNDPRYQQELHAWEQAELQRMRLEVEKARAQAERDRVWAERRQADALREQNRILAERNRILLRQGYEGQVERERLWNEHHAINNADMNVIFDVHVTI